MYSKQGIAGRHEKINVRCRKGQQIGKEDGHERGSVLHELSGIMVINGKYGADGGREAGREEGCFRHLYR